MSHVLADLPIEERVERLWRLLVDATAFVGRLPQSSDRREAMEYRNGLLTAYAYVTGRDAEGVYEDVQDELQARAERAGGGW